MCRNRCNTCDECLQPQNSSNKTYIIPVAGASAYEEWKEYYGSQYPEITTEKEWLDNYVKINLNYEQFEI